MSVLYIDFTNCLENSFENLHKINLPTNNDIIFFYDLTEFSKSSWFNDYDKFKKALEKCNKIIIFTLLHITKNQYNFINNIVDNRKFLIYTENEYINEINEINEEYKINIKNSKTCYINMGFEAMKYRMF